MGFTMPALQTVGLSAVSNKAMAKASSLVSVTRMVASAIGVAALTTYLTQRATSHGQDIAKALQAGLATHQFSGVAATCVQAAGPTFNQAVLRACVTRHAAILGLNETFLVVMISCLALILLALFMGRDPALQAFKEAKARGEDVVLS